MTRFIGRKKELEWLRSLLSKRSPSFVVIRGRRRIGKSRLIREFGKEVPTRVFSGLAPTEHTTRRSQLKEFCLQIAQEFQLPEFDVKSWSEAFVLLARLCSDNQQVIALDEISWIGSKDGNFLGHLKNAWDLHFSRNSKLILIVCGSVSSWIQKNILSSSGFVGRISVDMKLEELGVSESADFWDGKRARVSAHEILKVLAVTGGVPRYLEEIHPELSAEENIRRLCFDVRGLLYGEFDRIFLDLFSGRATHYMQVARAISGPSRTLQELSTGLKLPESTLWDILEDLVQAGFVTRDPIWNLRSKRTSNLKKYRLSDNYVRYYLRYIEPYKESIEQGVFESRSLSTLPEWNTVMGLQFENIVLKNAKCLLPHIGLQLSDLVRYGPFFQRATQTKKGYQIDLLIQSQYRTIFLCEVKFTADKVGKEVVGEVKAKEESLVLPKGWSTRRVLIHVNGVTSAVEQAAYFDKIIGYSKIVA